MVLTGFNWFELLLTGFNCFELVLTGLHYLAVADGDVDAGSDDLGDIPGQSGHQRSQILFSYKAHCDPEETFSPL